MEIIPRNKYLGHTYTKQFTPVKKRIIDDEKLIRLETGKIVGHLYRKTNETEWAIQSKATKANLVSESKYQTKLIFKRFKFNKNKKILGYTDEYINILTDLLSSKKHSAYPKERLNLVNFREKIFKYDKKQSYNNYFNLNDNSSINEKNLISDKRSYATSNQKQREKSFSSSPNSLIFKKLQSKIRKKRKNSFKIYGSYFNDCNKNLKSSELSNFSYTNYYDKDSKNNQMKKIKYKSLDKNKINDLFFGNNSNINKYIMTTESKDENQDDDNGDIFHKENEKLNKAEQFIINGDKDEYEKYLKEKFSFFEDEDIRRQQYIKEVKQRNLLVFKNNQIVEKKNDRKNIEEYFKKINREKKNLLNPELNKNSYSIHDIFRPPLTKKEINKIKLNYHSKNLLKRIKLGSNKIK